MKQTVKNGAIFDWLAKLGDTEFTGQIYQIALGHLKSDTAGFDPAGVSTMGDAVSCAEHLRAERQALVLRDAP